MKHELSLGYGILIIQFFLCFASDNHPENQALLYNLGLAQYQLGNQGLALGLWRKAMNLDSNFSQLNSAISFVEEKLLPDQGSPSALQTIYRSLKNVSLHLWLFLSLVCFFLFSWFAIQFGIKNKESITSWPAWLFLLIPVFILSISFSTLLTIDHLQMKATVIDKNVLTHTNPSGESPTISELQEGQVVFVEKSFGDWAQVKSLSGSAGWVLQKNLIVF